ncbi:MAG: RsfS/YbeB/iojap family protein, partial [Candidatus Omnitrophota bacterium]
SQWLLIDYNDVILHVFNQSARIFYGIDRLWREAKKVSIPKRLLLEKNIDDGENIDRNFS